MQQVTYDWRKDAAHGERLKGWVRTLSCLLCAACGLGLFFHLGSGGGSFIAAMLAFIVPCMGYKAVNNHSAKHLGWFNCLNICCAVVAAITMVGVLLIGIPIAECACHEECLVNMIDGFEEAANMTSGAEYEYGPQPLDHFEHDSQGPVLAFPGDEGEGVPESGAPRPSGAHAHHDGPPPPPPAPGAMHPHPQPQPHPEASRRMSRIGRLLAMVGMGAPHPHPHPHGHRMHPHAHRPHHPHHRLGGHRRRAQEHHDRDHEHVHEHKQGEGEDGSHRGHKFMRAVKGAIRAVWVAFDHHVHGGEHEHEEAPVADYGEPVTMPTEPVTTLPFQLDGQPEPDTADEHRGHMAEVQRPHETHHVMPGHDGRKAAMTRLGRMRGFGSKDGAGQAPASFRKAAMGGRALQARPEDSAERAEVEEQQVAPHGAGMPGTAIDGATEGSEGGHVDESERHHQQREEDEHHWHHWSAHFGDEDEDEDEEDWSHPMSPEERAEKLDQVEQMCRAGLPYFGIMAVFIINGLGLALHSVAAHVGRSLAEHDIMKTPAPGAQPQGQPQGQAQPAAHAPPAPPAPPSSAGSSGGSGSARPSDGTAAAAVQRDTSAADAHRSTWYQRLFAGTPSAQGYSQVGCASSGGMIEMQAQPSAVSSGGSSEQQRLNPSPYGATIGAVPMPSQSQGAGAPSSVVHSGAPAML